MKPLLESEERLAKSVLHGLWGPMTVNGQTYDPARGVPPMTARRAILDDEETAAVLTFVRNTWGNQAAPVNAELVATVRAATASRGKRLFDEARSTCHNPPTGAVRLGPNLPDLKSPQSDADVVESILHPSKRIDPDHTQVTVFTAAGIQVTGIKIEDNDREVALRSPTQTEPVRIPWADVDEVVTSLKTVTP